MADCPKCGKFYQPTPEEERLIINGQMEPLCLACAVQESRKREEALPPSAPPPLRETFGKSDGSKLARVERFNPKGQSVSFVALPPLPNKPVSHTLRKQKKGDLNVMVLSEGSSLARLPTELGVILHTNMATFRKTGQPLWFAKIPGYWCPFTGVSRIEVPNDFVSETTDDTTGATILKLRDGGHLRLTYR